ELSIELSHRFVSTIIGITALSSASFSRGFIGHTGAAKLLSLISVFFLIFHGLLAGAAVLRSQSDCVLSLQFGITLISIATVFILMLLIFEVDKKFDTSKLYIKKSDRIQTYLLTIYTIVVVYTGALVRHVDANLVCGSWPFCNNSNPFAFSDYSFYQWIQMGHRLLAGILLVWTILFFVNIIKNYFHNRVMFWVWLTTTILIIMQVIFGALIIFTSLNLWIAIFHAFFITCFFGNLSYFILLSNRSAK